MGAAAMTTIVDPTPAAESFQAALESGQIERDSLTQCKTDPGYFLHFDNAGGKPRLTFVQLDGTKVMAHLQAVVVEPIDGVPCFQIGYAVPVAYRKQGLALKIVEATIAELKNMAALAGGSAFYVEAIVGVDNEASNRVATKMLSSPMSITDKPSGSAAFRYEKKVDL